MPENPLLKRLNQGPIVADGSIESQLAQFVENNSCLEALNLSHPNEVQNVHLSYISSGAEIIRTNTARANRENLEKFGLEDKTYSLNLKGAKIAKYARDISGKPIFIAGCVAPIKPNKNKAANLYREQIEAFLEGGVDLIIFYNFGGIADLRIGIEVAASLCELPLISGVALKNPKDIETLTAQTKEFESLTLAVFLSRSKITSLDKKVKASLAHKVKIIGGGIKTTPVDIRKICDLVSPSKIQMVFSPKIEIPIDAEDKREPTLLAKKIAKGEFVVSAEIDPPKGVLPQKDLEGAAMLKENGVDFINVGDSPLARIRMDAKDFCFLVQSTVGLETILHFTTRDRNLMKLQSDLLGAHVIGIRNIIALTGDPPKTGNCLDASAVYDIHSTQLVDLIKNKLNRGVDWYGNPLSGATSLYVAVALDLNVPEDNIKWNFFAQKIEAGADIAMTQPIFESEPLLRYLDRINGKPPIPIILGILPLQSVRHAIFLNEKVEGIYIPDKIIKSLEKAGRKALDEGILQAQKLALEVKKYVSGIYIMPSFGRYEVAAEVAKAVKEV